jgi:hypothetical protein
MNTPLNVFAQLSVLSDRGETISVSAEDEIITVDFPDFWTSRALVKRQFPNRANRESSISKLHNGLKQTDLAIEFRVAKRLVARLNPQSQPNVVSRLLGVAPVELLPVPLLLSMLQR